MPNKTTSLEVRKLVSSNITRGFSGRKIVKPLNMPKSRKKPGKSIKNESKKRPKFSSFVKNLPQIYVKRPKARMGLKFMKIRYFRMSQIHELWGKTRRNFMPSPTSSFKNCSIRFQRDFPASFTVWVTSQNNSDICSKNFVLKLFAQWPNNFFHNCRKRISIRL